MELFRLFCWLIDQPLVTPLNKEFWTKDPITMATELENKLDRLSTKNEQAHSLFDGEIRSIRNEIVEKYQYLDRKITSPENVNGTVANKTTESIKELNSKIKSVEKLISTEVYEVECKIEEVRDELKNVFSDINNLKTDIKNIVELLNILKDKGIL